MIVDLHSHLVPAVDDGASSVDEALHALRALAAEGVGALVTTPHLLLPCLDSPAAVARELDRHRLAFDRLAEAVAAADRTLPTLGLGQEIWAPDVASLRRGLGCAGLGLGASSYLLVEFGFDLAGDHLDVVEAVLDAGHRIVVAHPERYRYPARFDPLETAAAWRHAGALLQVNAGSLGGHYARSNPGSQVLAWRFIDRGMADLIATDHHASNRPVSSREAWDAVVSRAGEEVARRLMMETPGRIVRNEPVERRAAA
ncbi:MAG: CpsB/CapC family capsule biosynthesis tyrosine phosphatase [Gemmatimonadales bacterium]